MGKYKYEKFQLKAGRKSYILSQHDGDNWAGPVIEHYAKEQATKLGIYTEDRKYKFEICLYNPKGTEYTIKVSNNDGYPNGPMVVCINDVLYFGQYYTRDGFNGIVYRFKKGFNPRIQEYKHGMLIDECINEEHLIQENITMPLPFDPFYETNDLVERKIDNKNGKFIEYVAGDPSSHQHILAATVDERNTVRIGLYKNNALNGLVLECSEVNNINTLQFFESGKPKDGFKLLYSPDFDGYSFVFPKEGEEGYLSLIYCKEGKKYQMKLQNLDKKMNRVGDVITLPNIIDPNAPKPNQEGKAKPKPIKDSTGLTAEERLEKMIGLSTVKAEIKKLKALISKDPDSKFALNFAFVGNPGTGKTEVARLLAEILYNEGIIPNNKLVETDRSGLVAEYIGQTAVKTHAVVNEAMGGVLFIDEAYSLKPTSSNDFGKEAIDALIADMENHKGKMCFILAGYEGPIRDMIDTNIGFKSRVNRFIKFPDYSANELKEVAKLMLSKTKYTMSDDVLSETINIVEKERGLPGFANARNVRNILEQLYGYQATRTLGTKDFNITMEDIEAYKKKDTVEDDHNIPAIERLNNLIGLSNVKKEILKLKALLSKFKGNIGKTNLHMCFYGNPGTGKTEVARLVADILFDEGILPTNNFIEVGRNDLVGQHVGDTAIKTHNVVLKALNGVLFIDEAYSLNSNDDFGKEAINTLIADMENYRGKLCVILAGYRKPMEQMIALNDGFDSRINRKIDFPDYDIEELMEIVKLFIKNKKYQISEDALQEIAKVLVYESQFKNFANARTVRNILESLCDIQALRTLQEGIPDSWLIKIDDVIEYESDHGITFEEEKPVKHSFNLSFKDFVNYAQNHNDEEFVFDTNKIIQTSVNIKVEKDGASAGEGSGFFISPKGIIATCAHVVNGADKLRVIVNFRISNNQTITKDYLAEVIEMNTKDDVAIIGIIKPNVKFPYYPLELENADFPCHMTEIVMGGYPFGGDRFAEISITQGLVQAVTKDSKAHTNNYDLLVDLSGYPGSSGSGIINKVTGRCVGIFEGAAVEEQNGIKLTIRKATPVKYLWKLLRFACDDSDDFETIGTVDKIQVDGCFKMNLDSNLYSYGNHYIDEEFVHNERIRTRNERPLYSNIHIVKGDITTFRGDALVNAANKYLAPGGGVCGAIFAKAGYNKLEAACSRIGRCEVGNAVITEGFDLDVKKIIHAVGPNYLHDRNPERLLNYVYERCFELCRTNNIKTIAFPSISTGIYKFPLDLAVPIALRQIINCSNFVDDVYIYCYDDFTYQTYIEEFERFKNR